MLSDQDRLVYSPKELADVLGISQTLAYRLARKLGRSIGRRILVSRKVVEEWLENNQEERTTMLSDDLETKFTEVAAVAINKAGNIRCSPEEYIEGLKLIHDELYTCIIAAEGDVG